MGDLQSPEPSQLRVSDADREQVAEILREAAGAGRIDFEELDERLATTYAAKTYGDLAPVTADLPAGPSVTPSARPPAVPLAKTPARRTGSRVAATGPRSARYGAIMGGVQRSGDWVVPAELSVFAFWGGVDLDLREARFADREVVITVNAMMAGAQITVDERTNVVMDGIGVMGGFSGPSRHDSPDLDDDSVTVRVRGVAVMAGVSVERKPVDD